MINYPPPRDHVPAPSGTFTRFNERSGAEREREGAGGRGEHREESVTPLVLHVVHFLPKTDGKDGAGKTTWAASTFAHLTQDQDCLCLHITLCLYTHSYTHIHIYVCIYIVLFLFERFLTFFQSRSFIIAIIVYPSN